MKKVLLAYLSREGQTHKILQHMQQQWDVASIDCHLKSLNEVRDLDSYDTIVLAASIRYGKLPPALYEFITAHQSTLERKSASFVCVNLTARKEEQGKDTPEGSPYIRTFLKKSPWKPARIGVFAGALRYPRYRWFDRVMIQLIMKITGGETDTSKEVEYTNWNKVERFAASLLS